jgi:hypothetical protein
MHATLVQDAALTVKQDLCTKAFPMRTREGRRRAALVSKDRQTSLPNTNSPGGSTRVPSPPAACLRNWSRLQVTCLTNAQPGPQDSRLALTSTVPRMSSAMAWSGRGKWPTSANLASLPGSCGDTYRMGRTLVMGHTYRSITSGVQANYHVLTLSDSGQLASF